MIKLIYKSMKISKTKEGQRKPRRAFLNCCMIGKNSLYNCIFTVSNGIRNKLFYVDNERITFYYTCLQPPFTCTKRRPIVEINFGLVRACLVALAACIMILLDKQETKKKEKTSRVSLELLRTAAPTRASPSHFMPQHAFFYKPRDRRILRSF